MILSYNALRQRVQNKMVQPVPDAHVNPSSIDVRLGGIVLEELRLDDLPEDELTVLDLGKREPMACTEVSISEEPYLLYPGCFVLAHTLEHFDLPLDVSAEFRLKSSAARMGLNHNLAVWCDPGWHGSTLTLELHNVSKYHIIALRGGDRIGQMVFHQHEAVPKDRSYRATGAYNDDLSATGAKPAK